MSDDDKVQSIMTENAYIREFKRVIWKSLLIGPNSVGAYMCGLNWQRISDQEKDRYPHDVDTGGDKKAGGHGGIRLEFGGDYHPHRECQPSLESWGLNHSALFLTIGLSIRTQEVISSLVLIPFLADVYAP